MASLDTERSDAVEAPDDGELARPHRERGWAELHQERFKPAAQAFADALTLDPGDEDAAKGRARALAGLGKADEARAALDAALACHPGSAVLWTEVADLERERRNWEAMLAALGNLDPAEEDVAIGLANALVGLGRHPEAQAAVEAAIRATPTSASLHSLLGTVQFLSWRPDTAAATFARAAALGADDPATAVWHGRALRALGRCDEARAVINAALVDHEPDPELHIEAGEIAMARHEYATAGHAFGRALELSKKDPRARKGLQRARWRTGRWRALEGASRAFDRATRRFYAPTQPGLALIDAMPRLDAPARVAVHIAVGRFAWRRSRVNGTVAVASGAFGAVWALALFAIAAGVPFALGPQGGAGGMAGVDFVFIYAAAVWGALLPAALVLAALPSGKVTTYAAMTFTVLYGVLAVVAASASEALGPTAASVIVWSLTVNALGIALILALATLLVVGEGAWLRYVDRRDPHTACLHALADLLVRLRDGIVLTDRAQVRGATDMLERSAALLRAHLKGEPTGDLRTDAWLAKRADGHAEALRECKKALLSPGVGSLDTLRRRLGDDFVHIARGHWRRVPWADPAPATAKTRRLRARTIARTGLIALAPLAVVLAISGQEWIGLGQDAADKLKLIALGWAFLSILMALDPGFNDKLTALRGGAELLKPGGK